MRDILIREARGGGYIVASPVARTRHGKPALMSVRPHYQATVEDALRVARGLMEGRTPSVAANGRTPVTAQAREAVAKLKPQAVQVLDTMRFRGSITKRDAMLLYPPCYNLPGRIYELRQAFGAEAIVTNMESHGSGEHARYRLRPGLAI